MKKVTVLIALLFLFVGISGYFLMRAHEDKIIINQSVSVAEMLAQQALSVRTSYSANLRGLRRQDTGKAILSVESFHAKFGNLLTPNEFLKGLSDATSKDSGGRYNYSAISKWNLGEGQGLNNEFLKIAWAKLELQDKERPNGAIDWKPVYEVQEFEGKKTLLYLRADPAMADSCVRCHNAYEQKPEIISRRVDQDIAPAKVFKQHQLMGGIFVQIPVEEMLHVAAGQSKRVLLTILGMLTVGLMGLALFFSRDLVKAREVRKLLFWHAKHDALTRLPNRMSFEQKTAELIDDSEVKNTTHALCFLDLDQFKLVNETCGHDAGDELLCQVSKRLSSNLKPGDFLARLGGDEFGVLLTNCDEEKAVAVAERVCRKIKNYHFIKNDHVFNIGVSIGVVIINQEIKSVEQLMRRADIACYSAKEMGKNRIRLYQDSDKSLNLREGEASWVSEINKALEENRIAIYSQRIGSTSVESEYTHHEILVRLIDQQGKVILPDNFIPAAERYQLMPKLDLAIIEQAFKALSQCYFSDLGDDGFISINLSGQSVNEKDFLATVKSLMERYEVDPTQICFEITESSAIANQTLVKEFMFKMKQEGIKFALDDFGTGLSSLTYLKDFPVDYLKIDGSFIKEIVTDATDRSLVDAINQMAQTLGLKTIAEYVDSEEIFTLLGSMGIDYAQGYYIQKPVRIDLDKT